MLCARIVSVWAGLPEQGAYSAYVPPRVHIAAIGQVSGKGPGSFTGLGIQDEADRESTQQACLLTHHSIGAAERVCSLFPYARAHSYAQAHLHVCDQCTHHCCSVGNRHTRWLYCLCAHGDALPYGHGRADGSAFSYHYDDGHTFSFRYNGGHSYAFSERHVFAYDGTHGYTVCDRNGFTYSRTDSYLPALSSGS